MMRRVVDLKAGTAVAAEKVDASAEPLPEARVSAADLVAVLKAKGMLSDAEIAAALAAKE